MSRLGRGQAQTLGFLGSALGTQSNVAPELLGLDPDGTGIYTGGVAVAPSKLTITVAPALVDTGGTFYAPQVNQQVAPAIIANATSAIAPTVGLYALPGLIDAGSQVFAFQVGTLQTISPALPSGANTLYAPQVDLRLAIGLIDNGSGHSGPDDGLKGAFKPVMGTTQQISPATLSQGAAGPIAPTSIQGSALNPGLLDTASTLYAPSMVLYAAPALIAALSVLYAPTVGIAVQPGLIASTSAIYDAGVLRYVVVSDVLGPTVTQVFAPLVYFPLSVSPAVISQATALYAPQVNLIVATDLLGASAIFTFTISGIFPAALGAAVLFDPVVVLLSPFGRSPRIIGVATPRPRIIAAGRPI